MDEGVCWEVEVSQLGDTCWVTLEKPTYKRLWHTDDAQREVAHWYKYEQNESAQWSPSSQYTCKYHRDIGSVFILLQYWDSLKA